MEPVIAALLLLLGIALGAVVVWALRGRELLFERARAERAETAQNTLSTMLQNERMVRATAEAEAARLPDIEAELAEVRRELRDTVADNARLAASQQAQQAAHAEKIATLTALHTEIDQKMQAIATAALKGNEASFLRLAGQAFETQKQAAADLLDKKEQAIANLLNPVATTLQTYQQRLSGFEQAHAVLASEVQNVGAEARKLVNALQASPKTRGRWGEQQLQNVIELAGMTPHVDYVLQQTIAAEDGKLRPDLVIRLPGERFLVVDAKTPLTAYFDAHEAADEDSRTLHLGRHANQVRTHMRQLGNKRYWEALRPVTPDFVVMFIPGENFYAAAIERDPELLSDGLKDGVLIVSPTMLVGLAKTIALSWRQEKVAETAREVAKLGAELYRRLSKMSGYVVDIGRDLERTVKHYNDFVGNLESRVMPQGRRFTELEVEGARDPLVELRPVDLETRRLRTDTDFALPGAEIIQLATAEPGE